MTKTDMTEAILAAKKTKKQSWEEIASVLGVGPVWLASVCLGMNSMPAAMAGKFASLLGLNADVADALQECPNKKWDQVVPTDPLIYRFYEIMGVYGESIKTVVHEKFGDGIMSAIDFTLDVEKIEDPKGDRVKVVMNGKFLPYKRW